MSNNVRLSAALVGAAGLIFFVENLFLIGRQGVSIVFLPIALLLLDALAATLIITGNKTLRTGVLMILVIGTLVDIVILFGAVPMWIRATTAVLAVAQIAALTLMYTKPVRAHFDTVET